MKRLICLFLLLCLLPSFALGSALSKGSQGADVTALQNRLNEIGLLVGMADGIYGIQTANAVKEAQKLLIYGGYEVKATGKADEETLDLLYDAEAENALRALWKGRTGQRVTDLQNRLIDLKFLSEMADGDYGSKTEKAVIDFQVFLQNAGIEDIEADGVATAATQEWLNSDLSLYLEAPVYYDASSPLSLSPNQIYAPSFLLMDAVTGEVLYENNANAPLYPASTTKIVTLLVALRHGKLDKTVTVPDAAADIPADSSRMPVVPGEKLRMEDLLYGLMIRSGNDAANAIAKLCSGSVSAFVEEMNALAQEIGMTNTHFTNPHGYHNEDHYSTARDLATAARFGLTDPTFCQIATCMSYTIPATQKQPERVLQNTYAIFDPASDFYIPGAAGVKSGYTSDAGFCYAGAAQRDGRTLIAVILNVPGRDRGWQDLKRLFEFGFALEY